MPHAVRKMKGRRPYKIVNLDTGKIVGTSTSRKKAKMSAHIRDSQHTN